MICPADKFAGTKLQDQPWSNWAESVAYRIKELYKPTTIKDLVWVVAKATEEGRELHAVGSGWAFEDLATSADWVVSLENLRSELTNVVPAALTEQWGKNQQDPEQDSLVHVQAGIELGALNDLLAARNLAMRTLGGSNGQTLAGAVSTSTHGGDLAMGPLPDQVHALHLVTDGGRELWIERHTAPVTTNDRLKPVLECNGTKIIRDDDVFEAALVSVGRFGVIYAMVLQVTPAFTLAECTTRQDTSLVIEALKAGVEAHSGLAALSAALPEALGTLEVKPGTSPHFVQLFFNSQHTPECLVTRRWKTVGADLNVDTVLKSDPICDPGEVEAILHGAAALLRNEAAALMLIPFVGPFMAWDALHSAHLLELQGSLVVEATGHFPTAGEAVVLSVNALWDNHLDFLVPHIARIVWNKRFEKSENEGKRGPSNLITSGPLGTGKDKCFLADSIEVIFSADRQDYIRFLELMLAVAPSFHQCGYVSLRYSAASRALLSMHNSTDQMVVSIEISTIKGFEGNHAWMDFVEKVALDFGGKPHWGQNNHLSASRVTNLYGANLVRWREALLSVSGTSTVFSNNYTRQRGLEPTGTLRQVTHTRKVHRGGGKVITHLCGAKTARWGPVPVREAIAQIEDGSVTYFTVINGAFAHVDVVDDPQGKYLRSRADTMTTNNLDDLPDC